MEFESQFIQIGSLQIRYYGIIIVFAMIAATIVALNLAKRVGRDPEHIYGALTWAIIPGIIFARMWFVAFPPVTSVNTFVPEEFTYSVPASTLLTEDNTLDPAFQIGIVGVTVGDLSSESNLAEQGLETGDMVLQIRLPGSDEFTEVADGGTLLNLLNSIEEGQEVEIRVEREVPKDRNFFLRNFFDLDNGAIAIWSGGLSIFGALLGGLLGAYIYLRKNGLPVGPWVDIAAVVLPLGQAIGRWANYVNQELFGSLTNLPWAISIPSNIAEEALRAADSIPAGQPLRGEYLDYIRVSGGEVFYTFHPLFLYEALWSVIAFVVLLWLFNNYRDRFRPGDFFLIYIAQYSVIRFLLEFLRLEVTLIDNINLSQAVTVVMFVISVGLLLYRMSTRSQDPRSYDEIAPPVWPEQQKAEPEKSRQRKRRSAAPAEEKSPAGDDTEAAGSTGSA
ncbi:MAG: prolipoprotein diacylglyceryl transferase [Chloroflexota bacterium]